MGTSSGWPFPSTSDPRKWDLDVKSQDVPAAATPLNSTQCWLAGIAFSNPTGGSAIVKVLDAAGNIAFISEIAANGNDGKEWNLRPVLGPKWQSDTVGVHGHGWGYKT